MRTTFPVEPSCFNSMTEASHLGRWNPEKIAVPSPAWNDSSTAGGAALGAGGGATGAGGGGGGGGGAACGTGAGAGAIGAGAGAGGAGGGTAGRAETTGRGGAGGAATAAAAGGVKGFRGGRAGGLTGGIACVGTSTGRGAGADGVTGDPQYPQKRLVAGSIFRQRGHGTCPAGATGAAVAGRGGAVAAGACIGLPHRAQFAAEAGFGVPQDGQRMYLIVPCSVLSSGMTSSFFRNRKWNAYSLAPRNQSGLV